MMREAVLEREEDLVKILQACATGGHSQVGMMSNAGLKLGQVRITILPNSAFKPDAVKTQDDVWVQIFKDLKVGREQ